MPRKKKITMIRTCKTCHYSYNKQGQMKRCYLKQIVPKKPVVCIDHDEWKMYNHKKVKNCLSCFYRDISSQDCQICNSSFDKFKRRK